jgi:hypothetical protein
MYLRAVSALQFICSSLSLCRFSHKEQIQVRLQFLAFIFSLSGSPESMTMSREQATVLWDSLAADDECSDDLFNWLLQQTRTKEYHALTQDTLRFMFLEKVQ